MSAEALREKAAEAMKALYVRLQDPKPGHVLPLSASDTQMMRVLLDTVSRYMAATEKAPA